jgi:hypothetical protein
MPSRLGWPVSRVLLTTSQIVCGRTPPVWLVLRAYMLRTGWRTSPSILVGRTTFSCRNSGPLAMVGRFPRRTMSGSVLALVLLWLRSRKQLCLAPLRLQLRLLLLPYPPSLCSVQDLRLPCVFHRTLPPSRLCQLLPIRVALAPMRLLRLVVLRRASWCLAALPLRLVPVRAAGSGRVLRRLFQVGFVMFVFLLASVVPAYIFRSALSVRQAIRDARTGRLPGPVSGARLRVVCARVLLVSPVSRLLVPRWCRCLRLRWCPRCPRRPLHLPLRLPGLLLLLRSRRPFLRRLQRLAALPIGAVRLRGLRPPSVIPSPSSSLLGSSIVCRWRSLCCALLVLCSGGPVVREKGRRERRNKYIVARSRLLAFLFVFLNARVVISKQNFLIDREIELVSKR